MGCNETPHKNAPRPVSNGWQTLDQSGYSIQYPDSFQLNNSVQGGTAFALYSKQTSPQDNFKENINLLIQDLTGKNIDLDKYTEISENQIKKMISNAKIIDSERIKSGDMEYQKMIFSGDQGQYNLKFEQYYRIVNEKAYVLTYTAVLDQFDKYQGVCEKIMNSFKIKS